MGVHGAHRHDLGIYSHSKVKKINLSYLKFKHGFRPSSFPHWKHYSTPPFFFLTFSITTQLGKSVIFSVTLEIKVKKKIILSVNIFKRKSTMRITLYAASDQKHEILLVSFIVFSGSINLDC